MKKLCILLTCILLLTGCTAAETFETIADVYGEQNLPEPKEVLLSIPEDAQVVAGDSGMLYLCNGYEITVETMESGDINATLRQLTGFESDDLTVMETAQMGQNRYECVWTAAGEGGDMVGRVAVLDDGCYHYCVTVTGSAENSALQETFQALMVGFHTGS